MKRAKPHKVFSRLFELNKLAHNRNNIGCLLYLLFGGLVADHGLVGLKVSIKGTEPSTK